jgi:hypothetical protein
MIAALATYRVLTIPATVDNGGPFSTDRPAYEQERIEFAEVPFHGITERLEVAGFVPLWACESRVWVK